VLSREVDAVYSVVLTNVLYIYRWLW